MQCTLQMTESSPNGFCQIVYLMILERIYKIVRAMSGLDSGPQTDPSAGSAAIHEKVSGGFKNHLPRRSPMRLAAIHRTQLIGHAPVPSAAGEELAYPDEYSRWLARAEHSHASRD